MFFDMNAVGSQDEAFADSENEEAGSSNQVSFPIIIYSQQAASDGETCSIDIPGQEPKGICRSKRAGEAKEAAEDQTYGGCCADYIFFHLAKMRPGIGKRKIKVSNLLWDEMKQGETRMKGVFPERKNLFLLWQS